MLVLLVVWIKSVWNVISVCLVLVVQLDVVILSKVLLKLRALFKVLLLLGIDLMIFLHHDWVHSIWNVISVIFVEV